MRSAKVAARGRSYFASFPRHLTRISPSKAFIKAPFLDTTRFTRAISIPPKQRRAEKPADFSSFSYDDTIYAVSTGPGRAGIAIIRISGPSCLEIYQALCPGKKPPKPRFATLRSLYDPSDPSKRNILDSDSLVLYFPAPKTVTGEDVLELHVHGGPATVKAVLKAIPQCPSSAILRYAEPGEFTRRAFQNNRLDLAQVEALSDTLSAETEQQRLAAVRGNSGALGKTYELWRQRLLYARGELEALIDFSEDQHFDESPGELIQSVTSQIQDILESIDLHIKASHRGELLRKGIRISLLGPPNAGKSSLLNRIVGREASIVSQEAGTTRDVVEVSLDIRGYLCTFADTAGLRQMPSRASQRGQIEGTSHSIGEVELEGIRRAKAKAAESDVVIVLASIESSSKGQNFEICYDQEALDIAAKAPASCVLVNKIDKVADNDHLSGMTGAFSRQLSALREGAGKPQAVIPISCRSTDSKAGNVEGFLEVLTDCFQSLTSSPIGQEDLLGVTERQRQLLAACLQHLLDFIDASMDNEDCDIVLAAEHLRSAANCLSRITGRGEAGDVEEVLGVVFEKFCVGK